MRLSAMFALLTLSVGTGSASIEALPQEAAPRLIPARVVADYCAAWNTVNADERSRLLARVWGPAAIYTDPNPTFAAGRAALSDTIAALQHRHPGAQFRCSAPQTHHEFMRTTWVYYRPDRSVIARGMDIFELAPDGRIRRVTGWFGDPPIASLN